MMIRTQQLTILAEDFTTRQVAQMAQRILSDFKKELPNRDPVEFQGLVRRLFEYVRSYGFRGHSNAYRLVCWGVFFGQEYLTELGDGSLAEIAAGPGTEDERFERICNKILAPGFVQGTGLQSASAVAA